ncbi:MAG: preprotein translocase subunit SecA [Aquificaceae bacterium]
MVDWVLRKLIGTKSEREVKRLRKIVKRINHREKELSALSNLEIIKLAEGLKEKLRALEEDIKAGRVVEEAVEVFALIREAGKRVLGLRFFDVQLIGGLVLHEGKIAEMKTGEGKTLVATSAVALNAMAGVCVHVVTVNDYLARRDAQWMGPIFLFLGLEVGVINSDYSSYRVRWVDPEIAKKAIEDDIRVWPKDYEGEMLPSELIDASAKRAFFTTLESCLRKEAYSCDVVYGTNNEFGFDYLRDNMAFGEEEIVQVKGHDFAIIDEVDSILIDEARTPLIISGAAQVDISVYENADRVVRALERDKHYIVDEKLRTVQLTEEGIKKSEELLEIENLYNIKNIDILHALMQALRAHSLFKRDVHYIVRDGEVLIVDEFTGRILPGRRWSDGLHQAIEVKEGVPVQQENQTLASITFQNYFKLYSKLAGMTGTAETEALEFKEIYKLDVVVIPTHRPMIRKDNVDAVYMSKEEKWQAVLEVVKKENQRGRPVLVGTVSVEDSEHLSKLLSKEGIKHQVLNAKHHEKEAQIIAQAGRIGMVTISTNMAGRGTDILLGGNPEFLAREILLSRGKDLQSASEEEWKKALEESIAITKEEYKKVVELGGLLVIGTERHESRRIDNQLRGRAGRQGDPGETKFFISLEDDLLRIFGMDKTKKILKSLGVKHGEAIEHPWINSALRDAQKRVEAQNFQIRKRLLEYDTVMNEQRLTVYSIRRDILKSQGLDQYLEEFTNDLVSRKVYEFLIEDEPELWELSALMEYFKAILGSEISYESNPRDRQELIEALSEAISKKIKERTLEFGEEAFRQILKAVMLSNLDRVWREHLHVMDRLREGIYLRGYAQRDPLVEYKKEAFSLFENMLLEFYESVLRDITQFKMLQEQNPPEEPAPTEGPKRKNIKERAQLRKRRAR